MTQSALLPLAVVAALILALGMGFANAAVFKIVPQAVPDAVGGSAGWVGGLGALGGFIIPPVLGAIVAAKGNAGYALGFNIFVALSVLAILLTLILKKSVR